MNERKEEERRQKCRLSFLTSHPAHLSNHAQTETSSIFWLVVKTHPHTFWARKMRTRFGRNKVELGNLSPKLGVHVTLYLYLYIYLPLFALIEMTSI